MARDEDLIQAVLLSVSIAYSRFGHTMAHYSGINATSDKSENGQRKTKNNRLDVFAASLQHIDKVTFVSRGTSRS